MTVTALVVNWSTPGDLLKLVRSGEEHEPDLKWAVWQNFHEEQHTHNLLALKELQIALGPRRFSYEVAGRNHGHGYGINRLAARVDRDGAEYAFVLNPDCVFVAPIVDVLVESLDEDPKRFAVGPKQIDSQYRITAGGIVGTLQAPKHRYWRNKDRAGNLATDRTSVPIVSGSAFLVRVKDLLEYPMLESRHYFSETWPMYHAIAHGRENWYIGDALMIHEWHRSSPLGSPLSDGFIKQDQALFRRMCDEHDPPIPHD